ncbi:MAG TPA: hypothetical protein PK251_04640 [Candidatus Latescibacteria bacterium]|nr:hypothetical protein [Candidatus Latescibacterota bacterium]HOS64026.1 hypothetical protein [Candidatus Latescibacterota bacterium]HPK74881.1 hypothetical protein [Candidatus Latescibacterota bacterium]
MRFFPRTRERVDEATPEWSVLWAVSVARVESAFYTVEAITANNMCTVRVFAPASRTELIRLPALSSGACLHPFSRIRLIEASETGFRFQASCSSQSAILTVNGTRGSGVVTLALESRSGERPSAALDGEIAPRVTLISRHGICEIRNRILVMEAASEPCGGDTGSPVWAFADLVLDGSSA